MMVIVLGLILVIAGIALMAITEPAGEDGTDASFGIADVSEDVRPYFWYGVAVILLGIIMVLLAVIKI